MRIIHLSYAVPKPRFTDPEVWLRRINFSIGVLESMTHYAEILGIYHIHYKGVVQKNGVTYHFTQFSRLQLLLPFRFNRYIKALAPDVIIVHGIIFPWQILMLRNTLGKRVTIIAQHHAERPLRDIRQYIQRWADRCIGAYLFCSFDLAKPWIDQRQISDPKKIKEIMGTSSPFFSEEKNAAQLTTGISGDPVFLWVGGLDANKDPLTVARAFVHFSKVHPTSRLFMIYQTIQLLEELKLVISTGGAEDHIILVGKIDNADLIDWYNSADFIISSSHYEGSGIAVCEGLSCGCIPILTNIPSFRMMTNNARIGLLYEAGDDHDLFKTLQRSLIIDRASEKQKVLEQFSSELSFDANALKIMNVINELRP